MITGFNTDVRHGDTVYHVQTEDKGVRNPLILSLIYVKGKILDAFRTRYDDFLDSGRFSEASLQKILEFQHRQIVGAIKRGKYQKGMPLEDYVEGDFIFPLTSASEPTEARKPEPVPEAVPEPVPESVPEPVPEPVPNPPATVAEIEPPEPERPVVAARLVETPAVPPAPAPVRNRISLNSVQVAETDPSISQGIRAVDINEVSPDAGVEICVESAKDFVAGEQVDLQLYVQTRRGRMRLENVQVVIKLIGTTFSPRLYAGKTDQFGCLRMSFSLPTFSGGSAALIVQVSTSVGNDEVKYLVRRRR